jgi:hypothetical protein
VALQARFHLAHRRVGERHALGVDAVDELHDGVHPLPRHVRGKPDNGIERVKQVAVPVVLESRPATLDGVVLAVVRGIVRKFDMKMGRVGELHHPRHELGAVAVVLGTVVLVEDEPVDAAEPVVVAAPPALDDVCDGVGGQGALDDVDPQLAGLRYQDADGNDDRIGREVVVEGLDELPREPVAA